MRRGKCQKQQNGADCRFDDYVKCDGSSNNYKTPINVLESIVPKKNEYLFCPSLWYVILFMEAKMTRIKIEQYIPK